MKNFLFTNAFVLSIALSANCLVAQDNFSSDIDPFGKGSTGSAPAAADFESDEKPGFFSKLKFGSKDKSAAKRPNAFQKMNNNTKRFMKKSRQTLMPWTVKKKSAPVTGLREKKEKKKSFLAELLKPFPDEPEPITTADDWFRQPKPTLR